jgi:hypothetical protein
MHFSLHHLNIHLDADEPVRSRVASILHYKGAAEYSGPATEAHLTFRLRTGTAAHVPSAARQVVRLGPGIDVLSLDGLTIITDYRSRIDLDTATSTAEGMVAPESEDAAGTTFYLITVSLLLLLRHGGLFSIHAAGIERDGHAALLIGHSDTGKSTTTINLVRRGWRYASDDSVGLLNCPEGVRALSLRRDFCLDPCSADFFPELSRHAWPSAPNDPGKWRVRMDLLFPGSYLPAMSPRTLVFPRLTGGPVSQAVPVEPSEALLLTAASSTLALPADAENTARQFKTIGTLVAGCNLVRLELGRDALDPPALDELFAGICAAS